MNTTTSDFQEASKGKLEKLELIFDTYHGTMIRKKRCVRGWNLSSCCICTFDQPRSSPSWSNSNLLKIRFFYVYNFNAKYTGYSGIHTRSHVVMKYPIRCMRTPSKEERMNVEWVLFDGGTNTLSSELRNNKEQQQQQQQQQQQINICKSFERWRQRQRQRGHCWSRVSRETKTKMNDDEVFLATEVTDLFERRGLCACQVLRRWLKKFNFSTRA